MKVGYFGVIVESLNLYQGYHLVETPKIRAAADKAHLLALMSGYSAIGALQAATVEALVWAKEGLAGAAGLALRDLSHESYFVILGQTQPNGYSTRMMPLKADSVEAARAEIESMPQVKGIKARLMQEIAPQGRRAFH